MPSLFPASPDVGRKERPSKKPFKNIQDAIRGYLATIDDETNGQDVRDIEVSA